MLANNFVDRAIGHVVETLLPSQRYGLSLSRMKTKCRSIKLEEGGIASSVNMATLVYKNWKQEGDQLILAGKQYLQVE